jgi:hypothetical protein
MSDKYVTVRGINTGAVSCITASLQPSLSPLCAVVLQGLELNLYRLRSNRDPRGLKSRGEQSSWETNKRDRFDLL